MLRVIAIFAFALCQAGVVMSHWTGLYVECLCHEPTGPSVCASDFHTYTDACLLDCHRRRTGDFELHVVYNGPCEDLFNLMYEQQNYTPYLPYLLGSITEK
ncbi:unnamed protein product [Leptosia nina]|uniref:Kazal-like domain-containing protein n=1 Tax=Leptosia nina TaxID=320188 RepID=A0AAV1JGV9_9NEOP